MGLKAAPARSAGQAPPRPEPAGDLPAFQEFRGAEAIVAAAAWLGGRPVLAKRRVPKGYRHPALDARLRSERTRDESNLLLAARQAGVPVPVLYDSDREAATLLLERVDGPTLREALADPHADAPGLLARLGALVGRLHAAGVCHGDLTTSNVLVGDGGGRLVLVDFGLGTFSQEPEPQGVDLHLLEEALAATDARAETLAAAFLQGYSQANPGAEAALARLEDIRHRGRYR